MHHREKSKRAAAAHNRATQRLKGRHRREFDELLQDERERLGLPARGTQNGRRNSDAG